jgi:tetratricopeptide (TPR) repeat protein
MGGPQAVFWAGDIALKHSDYETAEQFWRSIESSYPDRAALAYRLAGVRFLTNHIDESEKIIRDVFESGARSADLYNLLAWCYERQNRMEDAIGAMDQAIILEPLQEGNYLDLATILEAHQVYNLALEAARRAVVVAPHSLAAYRLKAFLEARISSSFEPARRTFDEAFAQMPESPEPLRALAVLQWDFHMPKDAAATFESALKRFPGNAPLYQDYARLLLSPDGSGNEADRTRAVRLLETALKLDENLPEAHYEMGKVALEDDRLAEALGHLKRAAELDPGSSKIRHMLGRVYRTMGRSKDLAREIDLFEKLKQEEQNNSPGIRRRL